MIISKIEFEGHVYYDVHAEQSVSSAFMDDVGSGNSGIYEEMLTTNTVDRILHDVQSAASSHIVFDFKGINSSHNNVRSQFSNIAEASGSVTLLNVSESLVETIGASIYTNPLNTSDNGIFKTFIMADKGETKCECPQKVFDFQFSKILQKNTRKVENDRFPHSSSSVYLNKYIDLKKMISIDNSFFIFSIYQLAKKINRTWPRIKGQEITLVCQNLNSSYIASVLSSFLNLNVLILDKIGPINKLYSTLDKKIEEGKNYLVVSDLVCLGTEVKIAKNLITYIGGIYRGNVSMIRIETVLPEDRPINDTEYVFKISNDNNPIDYKLITALDIKK